MADEAAPIEGFESPDEAAEQAEPTTPAPDNEATWKRRIAGKDQALTATKKEAESLKAQLAEYQRKVAAYEEANLTEVERLQRQLEALNAEKEAARAEALRLRLQGRFPLTFETLGELAPLDEAALAEVESRLVSLKTPEEPEPLVDRNNPRRPTIPTRPQEKKSVDELEADLASLGNPFLELGFRGVSHP